MRYEKTYHAIPGKRFMSTRLYRDLTENEKMRLGWKAKVTKELHALPAPKVPTRLEKGDEVSEEEYTRRRVPARLRATFRSKTKEA